MFRTFVLGGGTARALLIAVLAVSAYTDETAPRSQGGSYGDLAVAIPNLNPPNRVVARSELRPVANDEPPPPPDDGNGDGGDSTSDDWITNQWPATIVTTWTDAGYTSTEAWAQTYMQYWATDASETVKLDLYYQGTLVGSNSGSTGQSDYFPWTRALYAQTSMGINHTCGFSTNATGTHAAFQHGPGFGTWGNESKSESKVAAQSTCNPSSGGGGGGGPSDGGGDDGGYIVTICTQNDYYDANGDYLYSSDPVCEQIYVT